VCALGKDSYLDMHPLDILTLYPLLGKDSYLDMHHDASECTLNVCLGREFEGGGLTFCGQFGSGTEIIF
jgi:hypothetical protein